MNRYMTCIKEMNTFIQPGCIKFIKVTDKIHLLCYISFILQINAVLFNIKIYYGFIKVLSCTNVLNIDNNKKANQHIRKISEGSCDTEDLNNDALHH